MCVCVCVLQCYHTDVSQSAPPRAAACPRLGLLPRQEVSVLTHCVLVARRGGIHPITLQQGRVRRIIFPVRMGRVNFIVTAASTELMFPSFLQLLARTCQTLMFKKTMRALHMLHIRKYSGSESLVMLEICMIYQK